MNLARATDAEALEICDLMNSAYRDNDGGWTTESNLVSGSRVTVEQVKKMIFSASSVFFVHKLSEKIIACICIDSCNGIAHIGSFAVSPKHQGNGVGSSIITAAEQFAKVHLAATKYIMLVLAPRHELISYYERRGYQKTGKTMPFPTHLNVGIPLEKNMLVIELEKNAS